MSFLLLQAGDAAALFAERPVIKAAERRRVADAAALLGQAADAARTMRAEAETALSVARAQGLAEGVDAVRAEVAAGLATLAREVAEAERRREEEIAGAAMAALEAIIGAAGVERIGPALVRQALGAFAAEGAVTVEVSPALAEAMREELNDHPDVTLVADPELGPLDCQLKVAGGTVRAGLSVQLSALRERWGLDATG